MAGERERERKIEDCLSDWRMRESDFLRCARECGTVASIGLIKRVFRFIRGVLLYALLEL